MLLLARPLNIAALVAIGISAWLSVTLLTLINQSARELQHQRRPPHAAQGGPSLYNIPALLGKKPRPDACAAWNPHGRPADDPPGCLRARQLRQIQALRKAGFELDDGQKLALAELERCVLGVRQCPERPLLISDFWYSFTRKRSSSGEAIWLDPVLDFATEENFVLMTFSFYLKEGELAPLSWNATRMLSESLHMYIPTKDYGFQCLSDPRCVRPEDYTPHPDRALRHNTERLQPHEFGTTPAWRVFIATYWGDRPNRYNGQGESAQGQWGQSADDESPYSSHLLDNRWHIVPWAYPGHTHLPLTIEQTCLTSPTVPYAQRNDSVLVLAKQSEYFHRPEAPAGWDDVVRAMRDEGIEIWTAPQEITDEHPIPAGLRRLPPMEKIEYGHTLSRIKALVGIGNPQVSPSPFNSICRGVPVLIPYYTDDGPTPGGWKTFKDKWTQHGPALAVGEPWVYAYRGTEDLIRQLRKAVSTPIEGYVPPDMTLQHVGERVRAWLYADWEGAYAALRKQRKVLEYPPIMAARCHASGVCKIPILT